MKNFVALLFLLPHFAFADNLQVPLTSHHWNGLEANEANLGLIYERTLTNRVSLLAGGYRNSYRETTYLVGGEYQIGHFGVQAALATGYSQAFGNTIQPIGAVFAELGPSALRFRLTVIPHKDGALGLSLIYAIR